MDGKVMIVSKGGKIELQATLPPAEVYFMLAQVQKALLEPTQPPTNGVAPPTESEAELLRRLRH